MILFSLPVAILLAIYVVGCFLVELEYFGWTTIMLIATVAGVQWLHVFDILTAIKANALQSGLYALGYVVVGVVWSFIKWGSYLLHFRGKFRELKEKFLTSRNVPYIKGEPVPSSLEDDFKKYLETQYYYSGYRDLKYGQKPKAIDNKKKITGWTAFWLCSMISTILNDPVRRLFKLLFNLFKGLYQKMADAVFANDPELK